ncbi:TPA_asm: 3-hydroxybutyryl-CoA dehydrogenase [Salmonella enterica subsp. salamae serovar 60:g,m,t:z6]|uniref:3-hydroxybutyryl-CoA dehydrogenase n=1 Tax=Salmonella enterica subsp. houtenae serovar 1,40:z4,z32:- TaxID=1967604 RepID=A0A730ZPE6_SALHO|nr:3-hydroxyacyl-CoA dehydrogenase NAD-binding domain-containing protein [Salmonella enterica]HAC6700295.1 3-hydroxybutyryl-CoA dehydrogenase [Salmonella bongori serovar 66:z65:-]HAE2269086.1 3-hydroxybutyryl-CoA dehydrogenase [Salmonella enterica subsp. enterica serovar 1,9,12:-:-]HAE4190629.1 3-hydroxybutyryl-CoA dehydrogenase [Salmonella enterica subsp. houtenae serovar 1,40:z4,z32:-]HAE7514794.1 3-hydroxybutyryl-CoA dehydrogenase [Salmonella enterica subsp. salamae serovar 60:g,m,t:z6]
MTNKEHNGLINFVGVVGAGTMGRGITYLLALKGIKVILFNRSEVNLNKTKDYISNDLQRKLEKNKITEESKCNVLSKIIYSNQLEAISDCELVIETIAESERVKISILSEIEEITRQDAIIASNTSSLSLNKLASSLEHPERFIGLHFFNPAQVMKLVEIVPAYFTSKDITLQIKDFVTSLDKKYVVCKPTPGFIVNRMARPFYLEGFRLLDENVAHPSQIDLALKAGGYFRMGPIELTDFIGQDINYQVSRQIWESMDFDPRYTPSILQRSLVDAGLLGNKNGCSYFTKKIVDESSVPQRIISSPYIIHFHGNHSLFSTLAQKVKSFWPDISLKMLPEIEDIGNCIVVNADLIIKITDGRTANQIFRQKSLDTFIIDVSLDYSNTNYLVAAHNDSACENNKSIFMTLMQTVIPKIEFIKDSPGLIVGRVFSNLINESVFMVENGICTRDDINTAAVYGVNYSNGIFNWLEEIGPSNVHSILHNISQLLPSARYYPHYSLLNPLHSALEI